ncbi:ATP-dependent DNA helicase [Frankliniella fusca]|uniref:ATP-dependent DNA helicase n=1 Tax=Frankliniella fusca TaxID=407009 RepID=A0AAE1LL09_9NEOP|nr:ATP-dependent DNA helicase [Frankliniella fusca]
MSRSSEESIFIPTFPPQNRVQLVKSTEKLSHLPEHSTDVFEKGLLHHYMKRPTILRNLTLADFAANYTYSNKQDISNTSPINHGHQERFNAFNDTDIEEAVNEALNRDEDNPVLLDKDQITFDFDDYHLQDSFVQSDLQFDEDDTHKSSDMKFSSPTKLPENEFLKLIEKKKICMTQCIYLQKNNDVNVFNNKAIAKLKGKLYTAKASDVLRGSGSQLARRQLLHTLNNSTHQDTMGISSEIPLTINGKYMNPYSVDIQDGLCNGATGTLKQIDFRRNADGKKKPLRLWIDNRIKVVCHNVQSLKKQIELIRNDHVFTSFDVLLFGETWHTAHDNIRIKSFRQLQKTAATSTRKPQRVAIYVKKTLASSN